MSTVVACPHCQGGVENRSDIANTLCSCPHCNRQFTMPAFAGGAPVINVHVNQSASASAAASAVATGRGKPVDYTASMVGCLILCALVGVFTFACCGGIGTTLNHPKPIVPEKVPQRERERKPIVRVRPPSSPAPVEIVDLSRDFWNKDKTKSTRGEFVEFLQAGDGKPSRVAIKKGDGSIADLPMNELSADDQQWVRDESKRRRFK